MAANEMQPSRSFIGFLESGGRSSGSVGRVVNGDEFVLPADIGRMVTCGRSTINSAFSARDMAECVEGLGQREIGWIYEIGLAGLASIDTFTHFNRDHSYFLLQCVDTNKKVLVLGQGRSIQITDSAMTAILGLREGGSVELEHTHGTPLSGEIYDARLMLGLPMGTAEIDTPALLGILKQELPLEADELVVSRFKLAYAILAVSVFFRPGEKRRVVPRDAYMLANMIPNLGNINWSKYAAEGILAGAAQVQLELVTKKRGHSLYGCLYGLEVLYFDFVAGGAYAVNPGMLPRILQYDVSNFMSLIKKDTLKLESEKVYGMFMRDLVVPSHMCHRAGSAVASKSSAGTSKENSNITNKGDGSVASGSKSSGSKMPALQVSMEDIPKLEKMAEEWLHDAIVAEQKRSKERSEHFFQTLSVEIEVEGGSPGDKADAHDRKEEWLRLYHLERMLEHLVEIGVGKYAPSMIERMRQTIDVVDEKLPGVLSACIRCGLDISDMPVPVLEGGPLRSDQDVSNVSGRMQRSEGQGRGICPSNVNQFTEGVMQGVPLTSVRGGGGRLIQGNSSGGQPINAVPLRAVPMVFKGKDVVDSVSTELALSTGKAMLGSVSTELMLSTGTPVNMLPPKKRYMKDLLIDSETDELIVLTPTIAKRARTECNYVLCGRKKVGEIVMAHFPFSLEFGLDIPSLAVAEKGYENMIFAKQSKMKKLWVIVLKPTLLKMTGFEILTEFHRYGSLGRKGYTAVTRMLAAGENSWYAAGDHSRWRHPLPIEWAEEVLGGCDCLEDKKMRDMFTGSHIGYDVETSQIIWAPRVTSNGFMVLYGFDFLLRKVHVFDPKRCTAGLEILEEIHFDICEKLLQGTADCISGAFDGWEIDQAGWEYACYEFINGPIESADAVLYCIHYMMYFDGLSVTRPIYNADLPVMKMKLMNMVLNMAGNIGHAPAKVKTPTLMPVEGMAA